MNDETSLQDWIETATFGLPPSAVSKIGAEIADHAAESRGKHLAEGMSADEAEAAAVKDLGDAHQLAVTFRDAHFSRREYTRGGAALLAVLAVTGLRLAVSAISTGLDDAHMLNAVAEWMALVDMIYFLCLAALFLLAMRAALVFLREQFDIPMPRLGWRLFVASVVLNLAPAFLSEFIRVTDIYDHYTPLLARLTGSEFWYNPHPALSTISQASGSMIWVLVAIFSARHLMSRVNRSQRVLVSLLAVGVLLGADTVVSYVQYVPELASALVGHRMLVAWIYLIPYLGLMGMLLWLFMRMRRPGAIVAR